MKVKYGSIANTRNKSKLSTGIHKWHRKYADGSRGCSKCNALKFFINGKAFYSTSEGVMLSENAPSCEQLKM